MKRPSCTGVLQSSMRRGMWRLSLNNCNDHCLTLICQVFLASHFEVADRGEFLSKSIVTQEFVGEINVFLRLLFIYSNSEFRHQ